MIHKIITLLLLTSCAPAQQIATMPRPNSDWELACLSSNAIYYKKVLDQRILKELRKDLLLPTQFKNYSALDLDFFGIFRIGNSRKYAIKADVSGLEDIFIVFILEDDRQIDRFVSSTWRTPSMDGAAQGELRVTCTRLP